MSQHQAAAAAATKADPVMIQLIRSGLSSIVDEMSLAVVRTARSSGVKEQMDFSTAICDRHGRVVAQGLGLALHLGSFPDVVSTVLASYDDFGPGDVVVVNDPYAGGLHLPDIVMLRAIFVEGAVFGYGVVNLHHIDMGGRVAGSIAPDSTEIFQEGLRFPPLLYRRGDTLDETFQLLLAANVRVPESVLGDLEAQENACILAEKRINELASRYGAGTLEAYMNELLDYAERMARAEIAEIPDGEYSFVDHLDDDGVTGEPVRLQATVVVSGDQIVVNLEGSAAQVAGAINLPLPITRSACFCCIRSMMRSNIPDNEGFCRPITVVAPLGSVVNPRFPAAVGARGVTGHRLVDTVFGALALVAPDRVRAAGEGGSTNIAIGGRRADGESFVHVEFMYGCWGGRPGIDGIDGLAGVFSNMANIPVELVEAELPIEVTRYGFVRNSGGPGRFRGGIAMLREFRILCNEATLSVRSDRQRYVPYGLHGGEPGAPAQNVLIPGGGGGPTALGSKFTTRLGRGDRFLHVLAGAGGLGDPWTRSPAAVARDVEDDKIDVEHARERYGVVVDPITFQVDELATTELRAARRTAA